MTIYDIKNVVLVHDDILFPMSGVEDLYPVPDIFNEFKIKKISI